MGEDEKKRGNHSPWKTRRRREGDDRDLSVKSKLRLNKSRRMMLVRSGSRWTTARNCASSSEEAVIAVVAAAAADFLEAVPLDAGTVCGGGGTNGASFSTMPNSAIWLLFSTKTLDRRG